MTEVLAGAQDSSTLPNASSQSTQSAEEKLLRQSEVNEIVGREKREAVERYKREIASQEVANRSQYINQPSQQPSFNADEIKKLAAEEAHRLRDEWIRDAQRQAMETEGQRIANEFFNKISTGKSKFEDFDKVISTVDFSDYANTVQLANMVDNTDEVIYELANNPIKMEYIESMANRKNGSKLAYQEMQKLSQSIKDNKQAQNFKSPKEPLSSMRSSSSTGMDNGVQAIRDLRKKYRA